MYPVCQAKDTKRVIAAHDTSRIVPAMTPWYQRARALMEAKGIAQRDLMKPLGVKTRSTIGHYLSGRRNPTPAQLEALANALGVSLDELFGRRPKVGVQEAQATYGVEPDWALLRELAELVDGVLREHGHTIPPTGVLDIARIYYRRIKEDRGTMPNGAEIIDLMEFAQRKQETVPHAKAPHPRRS